ncbi:MAG TPA: 16S rRNA (adenine(1518)-N(6)/adenine(1519)-N(6))-dimethyltransferase RsmA [Candidatus Thermoplasmatota archaeon]|nr:16S rRNA (adenine(1518)-N(6)/adenine(1519)-N(6))-dimethyltransferase RsmA [Candidatus Thermoplasmatota archaeon]
MVQAPDPFRRGRPHPQSGGTDDPGFRNPAAAPFARQRRDLGQHFLRDERVLEDVLVAADLRLGQRVLEVGPGPGNLTRRLAQAVGLTGHVVAIEADPRLAAPLRGRWPNVEVVQGDAVQADLAALGRPAPPAARGFDRIVANLPYLISGPITVAFLDLLRDPATRWGLAVLMYQREFGERLLARAGDGAYGRLSVHTARWVQVGKVRDVPPGCFDPPPKVDSVVVTLRPHPAPPFEVADEAVWRAVVDGSFHQRRKQLRNTVPAAVAGLGIPVAVAGSVLEEMGLASERPEQVEPAVFAELARRLREP